MNFWGEMLAIFKQRKVKKIYEKKAIYYEKALDEISKLHILAKQMDEPLYVWFFNLAIFTLMGSYELWSFQLSYASACRKHEQNLYARLVCLTMIEMSEDLLSLTAKEYHCFFNEVVKDPAIKARAELFRRELVQFNKDNEKELRDIRNAVIAHKEHNIDNQVKVIVNMDNMKFMETAMYYMTLIEKLHTIQNAIIMPIFNNPDIMKTINRNQA